MKKWMSSVREFLSDEAASTAIEYGLIASLVGLVMAVGATALGNDLSAMFTAIGGKLTIKGRSVNVSVPLAVRSDWVHNSNDSFFYTHPAQKFEGIGFMVGDDFVRRPRTRAGSSPRSPTPARRRCSARRFR